MVVSYFLTISGFSGQGFFLLGMFLVYFSRARSGDFALPTPRPSVGAGLGNRATHLWFRTRFRNCGLELGGSWRIPWYISSRPTDPPYRSGAGGVLNNIDNTYWGTRRSRYCATFWLYVDTFLPYPRCGYHGDRWLWLAIYSYPFRLGIPYFHVLGVSCLPCDVAVQRCRSGF